MVWPIIAAAAASVVAPMIMNAINPQEQPSVDMPANVGAAVLRGTQSAGGPTTGGGAAFGGDNSSAQQMAANSQNARTTINSPFLAAALSGGGPPGYG